MRNRAAHEKLFGDPRTLTLKILALDRLTRGYRMRTSTIYMLVASLKDGKVLLLHNLDNNRKMAMIVA